MGRIRRAIRATLDECSAQADAVEHGNNRWDGETAGQVLRSAVKATKSRIKNKKN